MKDISRFFARIKDSRVLGSVLGYRKGKIAKVHLEMIHVAADDTGV